MRHFLRGEKAPLGFRGWVILHFSIIWIILGLATIATPQRQAAAQLEHGHVSLLVALAPTWLQVTLWVLPALIAIAFSRGKPTRSRDRMAFMSLVFPVSVECFSFLWAGVISLALWRHFIFVYFAGSVMYGIFVSLIVILSFWPEPGPHVAHAVRADE